MTLEPGFPCKRCGVRADVACRHRPAEASIERPEPPSDHRKDGWRYGNVHGKNFHRSRKSL